MPYRTVSRTVVMTALMALAVGASLTAGPAPTAANEQAVQVQAGRYGPFTTMSRANEVATYFRSRGYNAHAYPEWGSYYVNVWSEDSDSSEAPHVDGGGHPGRS